MSALGGIRGRDHHELLALAFDLVRLVGVARVQEAVALRRDDVERIELGELRDCVSATLARRHIAGQRIDGLARLLALVHGAERSGDEVLGVVAAGTRPCRTASGTCLRRAACACPACRRRFCNSRACLKYSMSMPPILRIVPVDVCSAKLAVGHFELGSSKPISLASKRHISLVGLHSPGGSIAFSLIGEIEVAPGPHHVLGLAGHGGRQDDVGILRRVGDEMLGDDGEQILALQPFDDLVGLGRLADRIGAEDEQALDRRIELHLAGQRLAELQIVDDARAGLDPVGPRHALTQSTGKSHSGICNRPPPT